MDDSIDILPLLGVVIYPQTVTPLAVTHPDAVRLLDGEGGAARRVGVLTLRDPARRPGPLRLEDCFDVGCVALVHRLLRLPDGSLRVAVEGLERFAPADLLDSDGRQQATARILPDLPAPDPGALAGPVARLRAYVAALAARPPGVSADLLAEIDAEEDPGRLSYLLAGPALARAPLVERQRLLSSASAAERIAALDAYAAEHPPAPTPPPAPALAPRLAPGRAVWLRMGPGGAEAAVVEAAPLPAPGDLVLTGQAGRAARDAALIARTWALGQAEQLPAGSAAGLHLHIPPGARPDDLVGAGAPLALAILGLLRGRGLPADVAVVGGLGLHGHLWPAGPLRGLVAAARALGLRGLVAHAAHAQELASLPPDVLAGLEVTLAERLDEVADRLLARIGSGLSC